MEHVLQGADLITSLVAALQVTLLVTSRERLNVHSESVIELAGLPAPPDPSAAYQDLESAAVRLFTERAGRVQHDFQLSDENDEAVVQICRRLTACLWESD